MSDTESDGDSLCDDDSEMEAVVLRETETDNVVVVENVGVIDGDTVFVPVFVPVCVSVTDAVAVLVAPSANRHARLRNTATASVTVSNSVTVLPGVRDAVDRRACMHTPAMARVRQLCAVAATARTLHVELSTTRTGCGVAAVL